MTTTDTKEHYHVYQFFPDETYEQVRQFVDAKEAFTAFMHYTTSVGAKLGTTVRVIIVDMGDCINMEWEYGQGIIYPTKEQMAVVKEGG